MRRVPKILGITAGLSILVLALLLIAPFLVDLSGFKPQIQQAAGDHIGANLDFDSARLQIIPAFGIKLKKVQLESRSSEDHSKWRFAADDMLFRVELFPLLNKKLVGTAYIKKPDVVFAYKNLKTPEPDPQPAESPSETSSETSETMQSLKDGLVIKSLKIEDATLRLQDISLKDKKEPVTITNFDLVMSNIGFGRDIKTDISTHLSIKDGPMKIVGPLRIALTKRIDMAGDKLAQASFQGVVNLGDLDINYNDAFIKPKGIAFDLDFKGSATENQLRIRELQLILHNMALKGHADVKDLKTWLTEAVFTLHDEDLEQLSTLLPQHKALLKKGRLALDANIQGPLKNPKNVHGKLVIDSQMTGSDIALQAKLASLSPIKLDLALQSGRLDLAGLLQPFLQDSAVATNSNLETQAVSKASDKHSAGNRGEGVLAAQNSEQNFELTPTQKKLLADSDIKAKVDIKEFVYDDLKFNDVLVEGQQKGLITTIHNVSLNGFGGGIQATGNADLGRAPITFKSMFDLTKVRSEQLLAWLSPKYSKLLTGDMSVRLEADGQGTSYKTLAHTLNGKGRFSFKDGVIHTADVVDDMKQQFDSFVSGLSIIKAGDQAFKYAESTLQNPVVKQLSLKEGFDLDKYKSSYESIKKVHLADQLASDDKLKNIEGILEIKGGKLHTVFQRSLPAGALNFKGAIGLDLGLSGDATFTASSKLKENLLKQSPYASLLFDAKDELQLAMQLGGTAPTPTVHVLFEPLQERFTQNAKHLVEKEIKQGAEKFVNNTLGKKKEEAIAQLKKQEEELRAKAEAEAAKAEDKIRSKVDNIAKDAWKKLFPKKIQ